MKNTERYFFGVTGFIEDMEEILARYEKAVKHLEPFKGSEGYKQGIQEAGAQMEAEVRLMRETYLKQFREAVGKMRENVSSRPMTAPTPEQTSLLTVLQMRQRLSRDDLTRAAQQMAGCPAALSVLDDLAQKHKVYGARFNREARSEELLSRVDALECKALELIQSGVGAVNKSKPKDVSSCMERYGCFNRIPKQGIVGDITSENLEMDIQTINKFCDAVNG